MNCPRCSKPTPPPPELDARAASESSGIPIKHFHHCPDCKNLLTLQEVDSAEARVVKPSELDWAVIAAFLGSCTANTIVVPPSLAKRLRAEGAMVGDGERIPFSPAEWTIRISLPEVASDPAALAIKEHLKVSTE